MGETKTYKAAGSDRLDGTPDFSVAAPVPPTITAGGSGESEGSLSDYFGIPTKEPALEFSALWHRAYTLVWNDWFRDENLQAPKTILTTSGADATTYALLNRGKKHDYFTSSLPWPQKGADVTIPLGEKAYVTHGAQLIYQLHLLHQPQKIENYTQIYQMLHQQQLTNFD